MSRLMRRPSGLLVPAPSFLRSAQPTLLWNALGGAYVAWPGGAITRSGNELTDVIRVAGLQGDGRAVPDWSHGIWEAATNLLDNGGFESNTTGWAVSDGTIATDSDQAKFGAQSALLTKTGGAGNVEAIFNGGGADIAVSADTAYAASVWLLRGTAGAKNGRLYIRWLDAAHAFISDTVHTVSVLSGSWQRLVNEATSPALAAFAQVHVIGETFGDTEDCYFDGVQLEETAIATPYVETDGATAARSAARIDVSSSFITWAQGWVAVRVRVGWASADYPGGPPLIFDWGDDPLTKVVVRAYLDSTNAIGTRNAGTASQAHGGFSAGDLLTLVVAWDGGDVKVSVNGAAFAGAASAVGVETPASTMAVGAHNASGGNEFDGDVLWFACGKGTLADRDAAYMHARWQRNVPSSLRSMLEAA